MTITVDGGLRYESVECHRPIAIPDSVDRMLGRHVGEMVGKKLTHLFANAVQAAIDGRPSDVQYSIVINARRWRSMARVTVPEGVRGFTAHIIRLGPAMLGLSTVL